MQPDITLRCGKKILIIDTKYYSQPMQQHFQTRTWRSSHLYQIYTYVKNADTKATGDVMGLLLYAKAAGEAVPDKQYRMQGNPILVRTLDLQAPFCKRSSSWEKLRVCLKIPAV